MLAGDFKARNRVFLIIHFASKPQNSAPLHSRQVEELSNSASEHLKEGHMETVDVGNCGN